MADDGMEIVAAVYNIRDFHGDGGHKRWFYSDFSKVVLGGWLKDEASARMRDTKTYTRKTREVARQDQAPLPLSTCFEAVSGSISQHRNILLSLYAHPLCDEQRAYTTARLLSMDCIDCQ